MKRLMIIAALLCLSLSCAKSDETRRVDKMMRTLRQNALTAVSDGLLSYAPDDLFPRVYGVMMEYVIDGETISVLAFRDGGASLYTTSGFGIIGGGAHETIREAARQFVLLAHEYVDFGLPVYDYPYPRSGRMQFYFLTYNGVRVWKGSEREFVDKKNPLYLAGEEVLTWIRLISEERIGVE